MYKRILAVLLLCVLLPAAALADFNPYSFRQTLTPSIPSFDTFMGKYISAGKTETKDYLIYRKYSGKPSNVVAVAEQYVDLLVETFMFEIIDEQWLDFGNYARITYSLTLETPKKLSSFNVYNGDSEPAWETPYANVIVQYTIPDSGYAYVHLYYAPEFQIVDHTEAYAPPGKTTTTTKQATPTPDAGSSATK